ncbi:hypothetical protein QQF64_034800 [Cirrhinus molitorella]|uniref:ribonuclease H n=1 Tax=Cirrhinus molitorella TaxID=172907 RepID=A0ABR3L1R8_9TELE
MRLHLNIGHDRSIHRIWKPWCGKKNGDVRLCIDYRKLNLQTVRDAYALPSLEETFSALTGSKWFSVLDMKSGYYQIEVEEADKPKTTFVCPLGFWEFNRMPQGVTNAPRHIVSERGVETDPEKIETLKTWPSPTNLKELRSFLGFLGFYRQFIKDYSRVVKPLTDLTVGYPLTRKGGKQSEGKCLYHNPKEPFGGRWTPLCEEAFRSVIDKLTTAPVLGFADPKLSYVLRAEVEQKIRTCGRCVRRKALPQKATPLVNIQATR